MVILDDGSLALNFQKVLIAVDKSAAAADAIEAGIALAAALNAEISMIHVAEPRVVQGAEAGLPKSEMMELARQEGLSLFNAIREKHALPYAAREIVAGGDPATEIVRAAKEWGADIIVIGTHGRDGVSRLLLGSVAEAAMRHAPCPVLVVRKPR
jgi:nucleotide-binding universal stress UspA family protein